MSASIFKWSTIFIILTFLTAPSIQATSDNDVETEDVSPFQEAAKAILQDENLANLGGVVNNFIQSGGGKQIGDMLMGAATNNNDPTGQILAGIGNILTNQNGGEGAGGLNPALLGSVLNMLNTNSQDKEKVINNDLDLGDITNLVGGLFNGGGDGGNNAESLFNLLPMIMSTMNSFMGPEAQERENKHKDHAWAVPPFIEKVHVLLDHFMNSELGRVMVGKVGAEKFIKIFNDENGKFKYAKFIELMENHSFRRHWIKMVTRRVADTVSFFADPYTQQRFLKTGQFFVNSFLKSIGFPAGAVFNPDKPVESISNALNHVSKRYLGQKINAKVYVEPLVGYVKELFQLAQEKGILGRAVDSTKLSDKLADTINLDIIEPIVRVNRAYKFAKKVPQCGRYVMCLVNKNDQNDDSTLPDLKKLLSRGTSLALSWLLSSYTETSFWGLYNIIMEENNCKEMYQDACHDFHLDEIRVTTEYVHNEL